MSVPRDPLPPIPPETAQAETTQAETAQVAQRVFPGGNLSLRMREEVGSRCEDELFAVVSAGGLGWWSRLVVSAGGLGWWSRLVKANQPFIRGRWRW